MALRVVLALQYVVVDATFNLDSQLVFGYSKSPARMAQLRVDGETSLQTPDFFSRFARELSLQVWRCDVAFA